MEEWLRDRLSRRHKHRIEDPSRAAAAVLVPLYRDNGRYHIVLIRRTRNVSTHKGQISFPGGGFETSDASLRETALRESEEEIGLKRQDVQVLGELDDELSFTSNYVISPYVGVFPWPYTLTPDRHETESIMAVPLPFLLAHDSLDQSYEIEKGHTVSPAYNYQGNIIWGASLRILDKFLDIWREGPAGR